MPKCKDCIRIVRTLTKEGLCAKCHLDKHKIWAPRFTNGGPKRASGED
jgi:Zn finger protein HypA/HybF involved in hydrogenase expression